MARLKRDQTTGSRSARLQLTARPEPYWTKIARGRFLGYRKGATAGAWVARYRNSDSTQSFRRLAPADDVLDPDGVSMLSFDQAQERARDWFQLLDQQQLGVRPSGVYAVADCVNAYVEWAKAHRRSWWMIESNAKAFILPELGALDTARLATPQIRDWHAKLAASAPRLRTRPSEVQRFKAEDPDPREATRKRQLRANRQLSILKAALNRAWRDGLINRNDAWARVLPFKKTGRPRTRILDHAQARRLINASDAAMRPLVQAALLTGARYGELCELQVGDFSGDRGMVYVRTSKSGGMSRAVLKFARQASLFEQATRPWLAVQDRG